MKKKSLLLMILFLFSYGLTNPLLAKGSEKDKNSKVSNNAGSPSLTKFNINKISTVFVNDGNSDFDPRTQNAGLIYPKGSGKNAVFESGFTWGGLVDGEPRVGGSTYLSGLQPGRILPGGTPESPDNADARIYRVRPDYLAADLTSDANDMQETVDEVKAQYEKDWNEWPAEYGAPYNDVNKDGKYEPGVDIPGVPGADQTIWFVANDFDSTRTKKMYGALPLYLELQCTIWGYNSDGPLGYMFFRKYKLINKGNSTIDSMYVSMWSDVDNGDAGDDLVGCDTTLDLGFVYNSKENDAIYDYSPPTVGFVNLQGPIVNGSTNDSAKFNGRIIKGKKNLPMTAFAFFVGGSATYGDPPMGDIEGTLEFYDYMQGRVYLQGRNSFKAPDALGGYFTHFPVSGNPINKAGWLDGVYFPPGDRRIVIGSGPINMAPSDTQEVVYAEIVAGHEDSESRLASLTLVKNYSAYAKYLYKNDLLNNYKIPTADVKVENLDRSAILNWGENQNSYSNIENINEGGFKFEGYNVYQLPSENAELSEGILLKTYDVKDGYGAIERYFVEPHTGQNLTRLAVFGNDEGIKRYIKIDLDSLRSAKLNNGSKYYFAVTSYLFCPALGLNNPVIESQPSVVTVIPKTSDPGVRYGAELSDTIKVNHVQGNSDGSVIPLVTDPASLTGDDYQVTFNKNYDSTSLSYIYSWNLKDITKNLVLLKDQTNLTGDDKYNIIDGLQIKVKNPPLKGKSWSYIGNSDNRSSVYYWYNGGRWFDFYFGLVNSYYGMIALEPQYSGSTSVKPYEDVPVELRWRPMKSYTDLNGNGDFDPGEPYIVDDLSKTQKAYMYSDTSGRFYEGFYDVPFTAWDVSDSLNPRQLNIAMLDPDKDHQWEFNFKSLNPDSSLPNNGDVQNNYMWILNTTYDPSGKMYGDGQNDTKDFWSYNNGLGVWDGMWVVLLNGKYGPMLGEECKLKLVPNRVVEDNDIYEFKVPANIKSNDLAKTDVQKINVFPNPYYGFHDQQTSSADRFVTFNHLPEHAIIRIFDLSGTLIRTLEKDDTSQYFKWDLRNEHNFWVSSGLYIVYIEMPEVGTTKILKCAVIQNQYVPSHF